MTRDVDHLTGRTFDVLVLGGGIYGLTIAYDAAQRGLSVALLDRADFGSGASFNHLRTIHGGLRYLQTLDLRRARESVLERRAIATIAPQLVRPLPFVLPLFQSITRGPMAMRAGFALDRLVGFDRNRGLPRTHHLQGGRVVARREADRRFPGVDRPGLAAVAVWYDYVTTEADRLTLAFALAAAAHGATLANYVEASALVLDGRRVTGVRASDRLGGRTLEIAARVTVNATGSAADRLLAPAGVPLRLPMLKAMNLVTRRVAPDSARGGRSAAGRNLFLVPWRGRSLFGTWESSDARTADDVGVGEADVAGFIAELNEAFPSLNLRPDDVTLVHRGVVPATSRGGRLALEGHEQVRDHGVDGLEGVVTVVGAKFTTARRVAERVTDRLLQKLARPPVASRTASVSLLGASEGLEDAVRREAAGRGLDLSRDIVEHLAAIYGERATEVVALCGESSGLKARLVPQLPVIGAQLVWAAREEMAATLADAIVRRTPLGAVEYPGDGVVETAAAILASELGWTPERKTHEIDAVRRFYGAARQDDVPFPATAPGTR